MCVNERVVGRDSCSSREFYREFSWIISKLHCNYIYGFFRICHEGANRKVIKIELTQPDVRKQQSHTQKPLFKGKLRKSTTSKERKSSPTLKNALCCYDSAIKCFFHKEEKRNKCLSASLLFYCFVNGFYKITCATAA